MKRNRNGISKVCTNCRTSGRILENCFKLKIVISVCNGSCVTETRISGETFNPRLGLNLTD